MPVMRRPPAWWRGPLWWGFVALMWVAALWRLSPLPEPWMPDALLLALVGWVLAQRALPSWFSSVGRGAVLGGLKDLAGSGPFGGWLVVFAATAWLTSQGARTIARDVPITQVLWVALFTAGATIAYAGWLAVCGQGAMALPLVWVFGLPSALATGAASLVLFPLVRRIVEG